MDGSEAIRARMREPVLISDQRDEDFYPEDGDIAEPASAGDELVDDAVVARCAALDLSDTDNGQRLLQHFGQDLVAVALDEDPGGVWVGWDGRRWDREDGRACAVKLAQKVGPRIALEAAHLAATAAEKAVLTKAEGFADDDESREAKEARDEAKEIKAFIRKRKRARWAFAVSSKNSARIGAMMAMAAPHLRRPASGFNVDPLLIVTNTHTLRFVVSDEPDVAGDGTLKRARIEAAAQFNRGDYVTGLIPCDYDPQAKAPKWEAFLAQCLPDRELQRMVRNYSATGLLGKLEQRLAYHYGLGANGKSVFLAVLHGVIGNSLSVSMPKETIMGQGERGAGQASPDLVRLFGRRMVRIDELKDGEALREDLVKRLTGGDPMIVRGLYSGYLEFPNVATPHMSGNGQPKIDGTDEGIWRRIVVVHWSVTIPEEQRRDFNEMVADLLTERAGILNWLIDGARDYLENGLYIAPAAREATADYRAEMDPVREFRKACLIEAKGARVQASTLFQTYQAWAKANSRTEFSATRFGREISRVVKRDLAGSVRFYLDIALTEDARALTERPAPPLHDYGE